MTFDGNRSKAQQFMNQWNLFYCVNKFNINLATPYQRVTQCLTYIYGPKVNNWVEGQLEWLDDVTNRFHNLIGVNDKRLWTLFKAAFESAFEDTAKEQNAERELATQKMNSGKLDIYTSDFQELVRRAR
jgi:hypothetical protein